MLRRRSIPRGLAATLAAFVLVLGLGAVGVAAASAKAGASKASHRDNHHNGNGRIADNEISIQLWNFAAYVGFGTDAASQARLEEVLRRLSEIGYRNVEPFTFNGLTAAQFKALLDKYDLKAPSRHGSVAISTFAQTLADAKTLRQKYVGSGGFPTPGISSYENTLATAIVMNELGRRSVRNGTGKFYGHNHQGEFRTQYADPETGEMKSAWQILVENTDPRYVAFQLDVLWATDGGADPVALLRALRQCASSACMSRTASTWPTRRTPPPSRWARARWCSSRSCVPPSATWSSTSMSRIRRSAIPRFDPFASAQAGWDYLSRVRF